MRVKMCSVHVTDPAKAYEFYTGTLGFEPVDVRPEMGLYVVGSPDGSALLLEPSTQPVARDYMEGVRAMGLPVIVLGVDDVRAEVHRLRDLGVTVVMDPMTAADGTTMATIDDTVGNLLLLHQDAPDGA